MGPVEDTPIAEARAQMETNFFGVLRVCRAALPVMREQRSGHIVNISSLGGIFGIPFSGIYSAEYEREIMGKLAEMEREECRGQAAPKLDNPKKGAGDQKAGGRTPAPGSVPDQRSGPDRDRRDRCGNRPIGAQRIWHRLEHVSHREAVRLAHHLSSTQGHERRQPVKKQKKRGSASSRVAAGLRMAALSLRNSKTALDAYYRHVAARKGGDVAVFATARKLATLIYRLLRWGQPYLDAGAAYEKRYQEGRIKRLTASAKDLGYQLTPLATTA
jgi:NAD(P)-dependent dehydrogenase (short-subunit alcohol dehydrogenase family)